MHNRRRPENREKGVLLPVFSLPSKYGIGCFSKEAKEFIDWLQRTGHTYWQILPLNPTGTWDSPYQPLSSFAGNAYFIDPVQLVEQGLLSQEELDEFEFGDIKTQDGRRPSDPAERTSEAEDRETTVKAGGSPQGILCTGIGRVDYEALYESREEMLRLAHRRFRARVEALAGNSHPGNSGADQSDSRETAAPLESGEETGGGCTAGAGQGAADSSEACQVSAGVAEPCQAIAETARAYHAFVADNAAWLEDYALFMALREIYGKELSWDEWPENLRRREPETIAKVREEHGERIRYQRWCQFEFFRQWGALKRYANEAGIRIIGDMPIYVSYDSADCWAAPEQFQLDEDLKTTEVAGVPPDPFSEEGQMWGNPLYDWEGMKRDGYQWWVSRIRQSFRLYDVLRLDHFRGYEAYYAIPADAENGKNGTWYPGPGMDLFHTLEGIRPDGLPGDALSKGQEVISGDLPGKDLGAGLDEKPGHVQSEPAADGPKDTIGQDAAGTDLPLRERFIAEDLGFLTDGVRQLLHDSGFSGTKVIQFAFDYDPNNPYLPENYPENCVVYTGTHDNDTTVGWFRALSREEQAGILQYLGYPADEAWRLVQQEQAAEGEGDRTRNPFETADGSSGDGGGYPEDAAEGKAEDVIWGHRVEPSEDPAILATDGLIARILDSRARIAIVPLQDYLHMGSEARTNVPGTVGENWRVRIARVV